MRGVKLVLVHHPDMWGRRGANSASPLYQRVMGACGGRNCNMEAAPLWTNLSSGACCHVSIETSGNWVPRAVSRAVTSFSPVQLGCGGTLRGSNIFFNKKSTRTVEAARDGLICATLGETVYHYRAATLLSQGKLLSLIQEHHQNYPSMIYMCIACWRRGNVRDWCICRSEAILVGLPGRMDQHPSSHPRSASAPFQFPAQEHPLSTWLFTLSAWAARTKWASSICRG